MKFKTRQTLQEEEKKRDAVTDNKLKIFLTVACNQHTVKDHIYNTIKHWFSVRYSFTTQQFTCCTLNIRLASVGRTNGFILHSTHAPQLV